jgi:hypothetical protein
MRTCLRPRGWPPARGPGRDVGVGSAVANKPHRRPSLRRFKLRRVDRFLVDACGEQKISGLGPELEFLPQFEVLKHPPNRVETPGLGVEPRPECYP